MARIDLVTGPIAAATVSYAGGTGMSATDVEAALDELATEKANWAGGTFTGDIVVPDEAYDATGWNGSLEVPTKNAVRDKIEALAGGAVSYPRSIALLPWAAKTTTSGTFVIGASDVGPLLQFGTAQNSEISWDVLLDSGTYTIAFTHNKDSDRGIYSVQIDTVEVGTVDGYNAGSSTVLGSVAGITIASPGVKEIKLKTATKNGSSSSYKGIIGSLAIARTGA